MKQLEKKMVKWIDSRVKQAKAKGIVFGLSGGLDSAVVAALVKKAVGKNHLALILPCQSTKSATQDAKLLVKKLKLKSEVIDLTCTFDCLKKILPKTNSLAPANIKPRLRMITLYYFANSLNYLVCGTGNKAELMAGYFTKYGDGGVDILPIANLLKRDVVKLAKSLGIPDKIIDKSPSADLWPGQTDEAEMGITYKELDLVLSGRESKKKTKLSSRKANKVKKMIKSSAHKRTMPEMFKL